MTSSFHNSSTALGSVQAFKIDLQAFRRQLDAREMAQRVLDYTCRANGSDALSGLDVHEELVSLYQTPAERAIYVQGVADARRKHKQRKQIGQTEEPVSGELLQLCSHFRLEEADVSADADAETESASLLRTRADATETARQWLLASARKMEAEILSARSCGNGLPTLVAEQYAQLLVEVGGGGALPGRPENDAVASQMAGASAARRGASQAQRRHERDADDLILQAIREVRDSNSTSGGERVASQPPPASCHTLAMCSLYGRLPAAQLRRVSVVCPQAQGPTADGLELLVELLEEALQICPDIRLGKSRN